MKSRVTIAPGGLDRSLVYNKHFWPGSIPGQIWPTHFVQGHNHFISTKFRKHPLSGSVVKADYVFPYIYIHLISATPPPFPSKTRQKIDFRTEPKTTTTPHMLLDHYSLAVLRRNFLKGSPLHTFALPWIRPWADMAKPP